ncbi:hypothetical protein [Pectobacterium phage PPWS2]|uniref:Uncharacterized protein n=1 Tax=Pectobacterium phage PPWS2 TaxID=2153295 RepID=A0A3G9DSU2_9CAUD|nr:hypothetical protein HOU58_gp17 [Pectobacterium phage PPWS2]BBD74649.1 hypothetical protein [Pectobacterium phage PPWS2]
MLKLFKTQYRIVRDDYCGYEVQRRFWWCPFYFQIKINTHHSIEEAERWLRVYLREVVKYL